MTEKQRGAAEREQLANAMFRAILKFAPEDFNMYGFILLTQIGNFQEAADILDKYLEEHPKKED
jgi:hypothetical protein